MKLLVVTQYYHPEPFRITDICETLVKRGHSVTVITAQPNYPDGQIYDGYLNKYRIENINGVEVHRSKISPRKRGNLNLFLNYISFPFYASKVVNKIDHDFELVLINQLSPIFSAIPGLRYAKKHKVKSYLYCLDLWPESLVSGGIKNGSFIYKIMGIISYKIYTRADLVLVTSKSFSGKFISQNIKTYYLPQYAEDSFLISPEIKKEQDTFHCTFAGNIGEMQSVETILYAANELKNYTDIIFDIYGNGSKFDSVRSIKELLFLDNVNLHGRKDLSEMPEIYKKSDVLLVTLKKDKLLSLTLPGKVQTYLASGKPIIGAIDGETKQVIQESQSGYVCNAEDYISLSKLILQAKNNKSLSEMGKRGKEYYEKNYSKIQFFDRLESILVEVKNV